MSTAVQLKKKVSSFNFFIFVLQACVSAIHSGRAFLRVIRLVGNVIASRGLGEWGVTDANQPFGDWQKYQMAPMVARVNTDSHVQFDTNIYI